MRTYNRIKNLMLASAVAVMHYGAVVDSVPMLNRVFGTACMFVLVFILLNDADKAFIKYAKEKRAEKRKEVA